MKINRHIHIYIDHIHIHISIYASIHPSISAWKHSLPNWGRLETRLVRTGTNQEEVYVYIYIYIISADLSNHKIVPEVGPGRLPKSILKSIKINIWASVCPLSVSLNPRITKMVSQVPRKEPQGLRF